MDDIYQDTQTYFSLANRCEELGEYEVALNYYKKILKIDPADMVAKAKETQMRNELKDRIYYQTDAVWRFLQGRLELHWGELDFWPIRSQKKSYDFRMIRNLKLDHSKIKFEYWTENVEISCKYAKKWKVIIENAMEGRYPRLPNDKYSALELYISSHFTWEQREEALKYFIDWSGINEESAGIIIDEILGYGIRI